MLLPSKQLRGLARRVDICLSGRTAPTGCDIRYRQFYWLMVFDQRGELLGARRLAEGFQEQKELGNTLPDGFVTLVEECLQATPSLEDLERRYLSARGSEDAHKSLQDKVASLAGVGLFRVAQFLKDAAARTDDPGLSIARGIRMQSSACASQVISHSAYARLRKAIEEFIAQHPEHPACASLIEPLTDVALRYTFDLASVCDDYATAWSAAARGAARKPLQRLARRLKEQCTTALGQAEKRIATMKPKQYGYLRLLARLGRGNATLEGLKKKRSFGVMKPIHAEWRAAAAAKAAAKK